MIINIVSSTISCFFFKTVAILGLFFHMNFRIHLLSFLNNPVKILTRILLNLQIWGGGSDIFYNLSIPSYEVLHLFIFFYSFNKVLIFSPYRSYIFLLVLFLGALLTYMFFSFSFYSLSNPV